MKTILITGANGNLGAVTVRKFLDAGYKVIAIARSGSELGFASEYKNFELHQLDLADENAASSFITEAISLYGTIHGALFLAGGFAMGDVSKTSGTDLKKMISLNFETAFYLSKILFQHMLQNNYGRLVFIGARAPLKVEQGISAVAYTLSKSLLFTYTEILNAEAKGKNVTASMVVPGTIDTKSNRASMHNADYTKWVSPDAIANVMEFICSDKSLPLREAVYKVYGDA
ncbi:MAG: SDR family NAD(P)-dependent oxidoreductase [Chitinophagaceae bacterium]|nr:SDR family NAD(P)-dependent oxidoreductase [Chitinophagaceae bacterium]